jgi:hypothetical protein
MDKGIAAVVSVLQALPLALAHTGVVSRDLVLAFSSTFRLFGEAHSLLLTIGGASQFGLRVKLCRSCSLCGLHRRVLGQDTALLRQAEVIAGLVTLGNQGRDGRDSQPAVVGD